MNKRPRQNSGEDVAKELAGLTKELAETVDALRTLTLAMLDPNRVESLEVINTQLQNRVWDARRLAVKVDRLVAGNHKAVSP